MHYRNHYSITKLIECTIQHLSAGFGEGYVTPKMGEGFRPNHVVLLRAENLKYLVHGAVCVHLRFTEIVRNRLELFTHYNFNEKLTQSSASLRP